MYALWISTLLNTFDVYRSFQHFTVINILEILAYSTNQTIQ